MMILFWIEQGNMRKGFRRPSLSGKLDCPCMCWFSVKLKIVGKFCFILFLDQMFIFVILWFLCTVWYVIATSSWIFMPNVKK